MSIGSSSEQISDKSKNQCRHDKKQLTFSETML